MLLALAFAIVLAASPAIGGSEKDRPPEDGKLRIIVFGAHPDDAELKAAGTAAMWAARGHHVKFVSITNGDLGHYEMSGGALARRRLAEVQEAARRLGITTEVMDIHDGELMPSLENRRVMVRLIREWRADVVMGHRPNDYHADHRNVGMLMQDAAFMVTVPFYDLATPPVEPNPVFLFLYDTFRKPHPFEAHVIVDIGEGFQRKIDALDALPSQFYETVYGVDPKTRKERLAAIPSDPAGRRAYAEVRFGAVAASVADRFRTELAERYGEERARDVRYAEAFEICEYGRQPTEEEIRKLFPFFPGK